MAATIEVRLEDRFSDTRLAMFSQDREEMKKQREAFINARRFELMRTDPIRVNPKYGHWLPEALFRKDLICKCGHKMHDFMDAPFGPIVSAAFRDCVEAIGWRSFDDPKRTWALVSKRHSDLPVKKEIVDGKAAWIDLRLPRTFFSDALVEKLEAAGLEGHRLDNRFAEI